LCLFKAQKIKQIVLVASTKKEVASLNILFGESGAIGKIVLEHKILINFNQ